MAYEYLIVQKEAGIARIILNRPQVMNALSPALLAELKTAIIESGEDKKCGSAGAYGFGSSFFFRGRFVISRGDKTRERTNRKHIRRGG